MKLPTYVKKRYKKWRAQKKRVTHLYLRVPHYRTLERVAEDLRDKLIQQTGNETASFTMANLIELMTQAHFQDEPEMRRYIERETEALEYE